MIFFGPCIQPPVIAQINRVRYEYHKTFICPSSKLKEAVQKRADSINRTGILSHDEFLQEFDGKQVRGENLAWVYADGEVVDAWMASPTHKANLLDDWSEIAIARSGVYTVLWMK